jgi:large subunit ribosomal protein L36
VSSQDHYWSTPINTVPTRCSRSHGRMTRKERPMKVRKSLRSLKNKPGAQVVRRHGKVFVINKRDPRFKARQG